MCGCAWICLKNLLEHMDVGIEYGEELGIKGQSGVEDLFCINFQSFALQIKCITYAKVVAGVWRKVFQMEGVTHANRSLVFSGN